jgi:hypothetical protein
VRPRKVEPQMLRLENIWTWISGGRDSSVERGAGLGGGGSALCC